MEEKIKTSSKPKSKTYEKNKEAIKISRAKHKASYNAYCNAYYHQNKEKFKAYKEKNEAHYKEYRRKRYLAQKQAKFELEQAKTLSGA